MNQIFFLLTICAFSLASCGSFSFYSKAGVEQKDLPDLASARAYLKSSSHIAFANYTDAVNQTGWAFIHIVSNRKHADRDQAYAAGFLEGYLTRQHIYHAYLNFVNSVLLKKPDLSEETYHYINNQTNWLRSKCSKITENKAYWSVTCAIFEQVWGLYDGYTQGIKADGATEKLLDFNHFYYLTNMGDLEDIVPAFNKTESYLLKGRKPTNGDCSIFVKMTANDLVCSHNTHNIYSLMLRVYKTYELHLQTPAARAKRVSFSSRPGDLESKDDFYNTDSGMVVMETSFNTYNTSNYGFLHYDSVPVWLRAQVATRMAQNSSHWATIFEMYRSGTHNSQWIIVDMKKYAAQKLLPKKHLKDIVWMCEEFYYVIEKFDVTQSLLVKQGYVAGYNVPYSKSIIDISQYPSTWTNDTRAIIFKKYGPKVTNLEGAKNIIRLNANDTGSFCEAIAPRCDVIANGYDFGAIDGKAISYNLLKRNEAWLVSSPSFNSMIPPFDWRKFPDESRYGMPDVYNFNWVLHTLNPAPASQDSFVITNSLE